MGRGGEGEVGWVKCKSLAPSSKYLWSMTLALFGSTCSIDQLYIAGSFRGVTDSDFLGSNFCGCRSHVFVINKC